MDQLLIFCLLMGSVYGLEESATTSEVVSRCTAKELEEFSKEYEACHQRALETIRSKQKIQILKGTLLRPLATSEDDKTAICQALDNLIDECTLILGWCYSQDHVRKTKVQQRDLSRAALGKMHIFCPDSTSTQIHIPTDQFAEKAQLASPLKPTVFETSSANAKLVSMLVFVGWQFLIMLW